YAYPRDPDGVVVNTYLTATTTTGEEVRIGLTARSAGVTRVELEVALGGLHDDPSMLAGIAKVWEANHPGVELATMTVRQTLHQMADGALAAPPEERVVLTWEVPSAGCARARPRSCAGGSPRCRGRGWPGYGRRSPSWRCSTSGTS